MNHSLALPLGVQRRYVGNSSSPAVDTVNRTCELSFSSTAPVDRTFGVEVLSHDAGAADLTRLNNSAPLLFNHDPDDILGVVERAFVANGKGRAVVRFGKDDRGEWAMQQAADGVLVNVSFSYRVIDYVEEADGTLLADSWEALEISLVSVPADRNVGIGRSLNFKGKSMDTMNNEPRLSRSQRAHQSHSALLDRVESAADNERQRMLAIAAMGRKFHIPEETVVGMQHSGVSVDDARARVFEMVLARNASAVRPAADFSQDEIGLSDGEAQEFSLLRAVNAVLTSDWSKAGLERSASLATQQRLKRSTPGFFVPTEVMQRGRWGQRAIATTAVGAGFTSGGSLVGTQLLADQFIEVLRNTAVVSQAGATVLSALQGNVDIPAQVSQTAAFWLAESQDVTEDAPHFGKLSLRPRTIGALVSMSRLMAMQSTPSIEMLLRADLMQSLGLGIDLAALSGSGASNQPLGLVNTTGVNVVLLGANGGNVTLDALVALETVANISNAPMEGRGYVINSKAASTLKNLKSSTGQYLWTASQPGQPGQRSATPATFNGYPVFVTNQARSNLTKGSSTGICSELFFGAWPDIVIGQWGALEILVNPYSRFSNGDILIRAFQTVDVGVRRAGSFAVCTDALTP